MVVLCVATYSCTSHHSISLPSYDSNLIMKSVLSVQSHVTHGYVGGKAATFPLQCLGWDVDNINTVNFSNHTGYGFVKGSAISTEDMSALFKGLVDINCNYQAVVLGYIPSADLIDILAANIARMKVDNPDLLYLCDPVMGDQGQLYVDDSCVEAYRRLLEAANVDIITPNHFELELLCGFKIDSLDSLREAVAHAHIKYKVKHVVVSSLSGEISVASKPDPNSLYCALSSHHDDTINVFRIPVIKSYFTGVGDMFTALLLDKYLSSPDDMPKAVNQVLTIMSKVLHMTHTLGLREYCEYKKIDLPRDSALESKMNDADSMQFFELRVIQARDYYGYLGEGIHKSFTI